MRTITAVLTTAILCTSCATLKMAKDKKESVKEIGIEWTSKERVNEVYKSQIDSVFGEVMARFNSKPHAFTVHKKVASDSAYLSINFTRGKFTSDSEITFSYLLDVLGLVAAPIWFNSITEGKGLLFFWYFPGDLLEAKGMLSPSISQYPNRKQLLSLQTGATFSTKTARIQRINEKLADQVYSLLVKLESK